MSLLRVLSRTINKSGYASRKPVFSSTIDKEFLKSLPVSSKSLFLPPDHQPVEETEKPINEFIRENLYLVGKDSKFQRKVVQEYLNCVEYHHLPRKEINGEQYDEELAKEVYAQKKSILKNKSANTMLFNRNHQVVGEILASLIALSTQSANFQPISRERKTLLLKETFTEIPPLPDFKGSATAFEEYIYVLTHSKYYYKGSSGSNGIIPKLLRNLFHPNNESTKILRTTGAFNDLLHFYSNKWDLASAREAFLQMKVESVAQNTTTFNIMLNALVKNSTIRNKGNNLDHCLKYLTQMKSLGLSADCVTWVNCFNLLEEDISKEIFLDQLANLNAPVSSDFVRNIMSDDRISASLMLQFMSENAIPFDIDLLNLALKKIISTDNLPVAWNLLHYAIENFDFRPNHTSLNLFLAHHAAHGRVDMAIITFNTLKKNCRVRPDTKSYDLIFKAICKRGYHRNYPLILHYMNNKTGNMTLGSPVFSYWRTKAKSLEAGIASPVEFREATAAEVGILDTTCWEGLKIGFNYRKTPSSSPYRKVASLAGYSPYVKKSGENNSTNKKALAYRKTEATKAIRNSMAKRVPYAVDGFGALKRELEARQLVNKW